jgi:hypothetical protein
VPTSPVAATTELRTLQEKLIIARARQLALEQKVRDQAAQLELWQEKVGNFEVMARGRWLVEQFHGRGPLGRLKIWLRIGEYLEGPAPLAHGAGDSSWSDVRKQLETLRARRWWRIVLSRTALKNFLRGLRSRLRGS